MDRVIMELRRGSVAPGAGGESVRGRRGAANGVCDPSRCGRQGGCAGLSEPVSRRGGDSHAPALLPRGRFSGCAACVLLVALHRRALLMLIMVMVLSLIHISEPTRPRLI
eukprot:2525668-Rhodomonas_salina.1